MPKIPAILYGAGHYAEASFNYISSQVSPLCICDSNTNKHGGKNAELSIVSFESALADFPHAHFFVSVEPGSQAFYSILNYLSKDKGISRDRIINYEPYYYGTGCNLMCRHLRTYSDHFAFCCSDFGRNMSPVCNYENNSPGQLAELYLSFRKKYMEYVNCDVPCECSGCKDLTEGYWPIEPALNAVNFGFGSVCNLRCSYCNTPHLQCTVDKSSCDFTLEVLDELKNRKIINPNTIIALASGEFTIHPMRKIILSRISEYYCEFFSNATVYDKMVHDAIANGKGRMISSLDAGTRATFLKIKGVDFFDKVLENLKLYTKGGGNVHLKYIFLPGINDDISEITEFISLVKIIQPMSVIISRDTWNMSSFNEQTIISIAFLYRNLKQINIEVVFPEFICAKSDYEKIMNMI